MRKSRIRAVGAGYMTWTAHIRQHTWQEFIERASALVGRRVHREAKLTEIWETTADFGALPHDLQSVAVQTFRFTLHHYQQINDLRNQLEQQAQDLLANDADYNNLMSLPEVTIVRVRCRHYSADNPVCTK